MPYVCNQCQIEVQADDVVCPECASPKSSWTLVADKTRTFVFSALAVELRRGEGTEPVDPSDPPYREPTVKAERIRPISKARAAELVRSGKLPPSGDVILVRLSPRKKKDLTVKLSVRYATREAHELEFPRERPADLPDGGHIDVPFLFVHGDEDAPPMDAFAGVTVVDITEDTPRGYAPSVHFTALRKAGKQLPVQAEAAYWVDVRLVSAGGRPFHDQPFVLTPEAGDPIDGCLDADGHAKIAVAESGTYTIRFPGVEDGAAFC